MKYETFVLHHAEMIGLRESSVDTKGIEPFLSTDNLCVLKRNLMIGYRSQACYSSTIVVL